MADLASSSKDPGLPSAQRESDLGGELETPARERADPSSYTHLTLAPSDPEERPVVPET